MNDQAPKHLEHRLLDQAYTPLPLGTIRPQGWLLDQLRIQAAGLTGHLDEFWPDIADSGWIGGNAEGWERAPYWLDGLIPLAFVLDDVALKAKATRWIDYILSHQHDDGWLGPIQSAKGNYKAYDPWPQFVILKALTQYEEATGDRRVIPAMQRLLQRLDQLLDEQPLFVWGKSRWADLLLSIHWLYRRTTEQWLLELAAKVNAQGFNWTQHFTRFNLIGKTSREKADQISHVVNNAMAIKAPGTWYLQSHQEVDRNGAPRSIEMLDRYHGQATGLFTGDEHLAGTGPAQGTELCAVVEYMFSLEVLLCIFGDVAYADRLERIAYNALPAACTPDMWAHQYDQQANQVVCNVGPHVWTTNGNAANIFGLEPNYGCCTANMHQGWPKFTAHLWLQSRDGGLAAAAFAPCAVTTLAGRKPGREHDVPFTITEETEYPFAGTVRFMVHHAESAAYLPLYVRIPEWATDTCVQGKQQGRITPGRFLYLGDCWHNGDVVEIDFSLPVTAQRRTNNAVALSRGPLVFSLKIGEEFRPIKSYGPCRDYEVWPTTPWNYALEIDEERLAEQVRVETHGISPVPFDPAHPPVTLQVTGRRLPQWDLQVGRFDAMDPPPSPVASDQQRELLTLVPYGSTHLRITEFPVLRRDE
ncbi:MAG: beta-L-arabinofuranosidase domain-containing protein [Limnochordia bacterium]|jgi:hypothetical protein